MGKAVIMGGGIPIKGQLAFSENGGTENIEYGDLVVSTAKLRAGWNIYPNALEVIFLRQVGNNAKYIIVSYNGDSGAVAAQLINLDVRTGLPVGSTQTVSLPPIDYREGPVYSLHGCLVSGDTSNCRVAIAYMHYSTYTQLYYDICVIGVNSDDTMALASSIKAYFPYNSGEELNDVFRVNDSLFMMATNLGINAYEIRGGSIVLLKRTVLPKNSGGAFIWIGANKWFSTGVSANGELFVQEYTISSAGDVTVGRNIVLTTIPRFYGLPYPCKLIDYRAGEVSIIVVNSPYWNEFSSTLRIARLSISLNQWTMHGINSYESKKGSVGSYFIPTLGSAEKQILQYKQTANTYPILNIADTSNNGYKQGVEFLATIVSETPWLCLEVNNILECIYGAYINPLYYYADTYTLTDYKVQKMGDDKTNLIGYSLSKLKPTKVGKIKVGNKK